MRILIIDQCSGSKDYPDTSPVFSAGEIDSQSRRALLDKEYVASQKARELYAGRQQKFIDEATNLLREHEYQVDRFFISAGFGLVEESTLLPPYEVTFADMSSEEIQTRSESLQIQSDVLNVLEGTVYDIVFFALGADYYSALNLEQIIDAPAGHPFLVVFNKEELALDRESVLSVTARTPEAKEHGVIVVELKGKLIKNFAEHICSGASVSNIEDLEEYCTTSQMDQSSLGNF